MSLIVSISFLVLYLVFVVAAVLVLLLENRSPIRTIAWILSILCLPFVGLLFFFTFGQNLRHLKRINKLSIRGKRTNNQENDIQSTICEQQLTDGENKLLRLLWSNNNAFAYKNTRIDIFTQPQETFDAIFADMEQAREHIHVEFYIICNDKVGNKFRELLVRKARQGVEVRLIYDYWGSFSLDKKYLRSLSEADVKFYAFYPPKFPLILGRINYRNHRKIIVIDGKTAYTGGVNIADRYLSGDSLGMWRDTMVRLEGAAVHGLQEAFLNDWFFVSRKLITDRRYFPLPAEYTQNLIQIVDCGPDTEYQSIMQGIFFAISNAQKSVYIHTPYFMPPDPIIVAIQTAALRGVDIRLIIPLKSDTSMAQASNASYIAMLLQAGVRVFIYQNGFLHSKTIVIDDSISLIGTANMDFRSYEQNFEIETFVYCKDTASKLRDIFLHDEQYSLEIDETEWAKRPRRARLIESMSRLFSPVM